MENLSPKYLYFTGLAVLLVGLIIFSVLLLTLIESGQKEPILIVATFNSAVTVVFFFYITKFVHVRYNESTDSVVFGNVFFSKEVEIGQTKDLKHFLFYKTVYSFNAESKRYFFTSFKKHLSSFRD